MSDTKFEQRYVDVSDIEVRDGATGDGMSFRGYAARFNVWSENLGGFRERIAPGAFTRTLKSRNEIRMYLNHNTDLVLASRRAGTLRLVEDDKGLAVDADLPKGVSYAEDLSLLMRSGVVHTMSFGFSVPPKGDAWNADGTERELREVRLAEVSPITSNPAYPQTSAQVRSLHVLSEKTGLDAIRMNDAITKLESGEELSAEDVALLDEAIAKLRVEPVAVEPTQDSATQLLLKKKQLDLLYNAA
jgi:HK97 family phage prohead protease